MRILITNRVVLGDQSKILEAGNEYDLKDNLANKLIDNGFATTVNLEDNEADQDQ